MPRAGACLLAANHISHFDPPILTAACARKIDFMTMREMFEQPLVRVWLWSVDAFPVDRFRADRSAVRTTLERLRLGRMVGIFPEGGLRDGANSILNGAPMIPGLGALAQMSGAPIIPCAIVGSDRLYDPKCWRPFRRATVWIGFGDPLAPRGENKEARAELDERFATQVRALYRELQETFHLTADDLPQPPMRRKGRA